MTWQWLVVIGLVTALGQLLGNVVATWLTPKLQKKQVATVVMLILLAVVTPFLDKDGFKWLTNGDSDASAKANAQMSKAKSSKSTSVPSRSVATPTDLPASPEGKLPYRLAIPLFVFSLLLLFGIYFLLLVRFYAHLYMEGILAKKNTGFGVQPFVSTTPATSLFASIFSLLPGVVLGGIVFHLFFELPSYSELRNIDVSSSPILVVLCTVFLLFLYQLCTAADESGFKRSLGSNSKR